MKRHLIFITLLLSTIFLNALYVEIGAEDTTTYDTPVCGVCDYGWSQSIYRQDEIGESKVIYQIAYNVSNNPSFYTFMNQKIYMKTIVDTIFDNSNYPAPESSGYDLVFEGNIAFNGNWNNITLDTPYTYDGIHSLSIIWVNEDGHFNGAVRYFIIKILI